MVGITDIKKQVHIPDNEELEAQLFWYLVERLPGDPRPTVLNTLCLADLSSSFFNLQCTAQASPALWEVP